MNTQEHTTQRGMVPWLSRGPLADLRHEMSDMFGRFWGEKEDDWGRLMLSPPVDVSETEESVQVRMDLPGVEAKDIDVQVHGDRLVIAGERKEEKEEQGESFHRIERRTGRFSRSLPLPCSVNEAKVDAQCRDGVLLVTLPKMEKVESHRVAVKSG